MDRDVLMKGFMLLALLESLRNSHSELAPMVTIV
jgi:hypothetical protein